MHLGAPHQPNVADPTPVREEGHHEDIIRRITEGTVGAEVRIQEKAIDLIHMTVDSLSLAQGDANAGAAFKILLQEIHQLDHNMNARFDAVNARFDALNGRFDELNTRIAEFSRSRISTINTDAFSVVDAAFMRFPNAAGNIPDVFPRTHPDFHHMSGNEMRQLLNAYSIPAPRKLDDRKQRVRRFLMTGQ
jgi:hypothetical protein